MNTLTAIDLKPFLPSKDFARSLNFYKHLGFTVNWQTDTIAELQISSSRFLLQKYYQKDWAENCMIHLMVENIDQWWSYIQTTELLKNFPEAKATPPKLQSWGLIVLFLHDPAGVLWHISEKPAAI